jgi:predicted RNase H-like nuclease (RuvC/YqgF family)
MYIPVARNFREELREIRSDIGKIQDLIPRKTDFEKELDTLRDTVLKQSRRIKEMEFCEQRLYSLNQRLIEYIDNIEEVKESGGVTASFHSTCDNTEVKMLEVKTVTIPEVKIVVFK